MSTIPAGTFFSMSADEINPPVSVSQSPFDMGYTIILYAQNM